MDFRSRIPRVLQGGLTEIHQRCIYNILKKKFYFSDFLLFVSVDGINGGRVPCLHRY